MQGLGKRERVQRFGRAFLHWGPVVLTASAILYFSSQPVLPKVIAAPTPRGESIRLTIHVLEYTALAFFLYRALVHTQNARALRWRLIVLTLAFAITFALLDEGHQRLIPNRDLSLTDVLADSLGAVAGTALGLAYAALKARSAFPAWLSWI